MGLSTSAWVSAELRSRTIGWGMDMYEYHGRGRVILYWGDRDGRDVQKGLNGHRRGFCYVVDVAVVMVVSECNKKGQINDN